MKKINNKGFTLVELVISLAILALLMTGVCALMGFNTLNFKKNKADITVQTSAQDTYNSLSDSIMQAKRIEIVGYTSGVEFEFNPTTIGKTYTESVTTVNCLKASEIDELDDPAGYSSFGAYRNKTNNPDGSCTIAYTPVYIKKLTVDYAVPIDASNIPGATVDGEVIEFVSNGDTVTLTTSSKDTCTAVYLFEGKNLYVTKTYKYMTDLNDTYTDADDMVNCLYSNKLNYVVADGTEVSGAIATIDAENGSIGIDLMFAEKSMSYTTQGMINIRNSYVLKDAK